MNNTKLISIIVPVYKVEKYIDKCINSILNQTYNNFELILVDDGSPDNCPAICDKYAKTDTRVSVIHKKNGGLSSARNTGIDHANGQYIAFIDSDDYVEPTYIETLYKNLIDTNSSMSIVNFKYNYESPSQQAQTNPQINDGEVITCYDSTNKFEQLYGNDRLNFIIAWGKLYKMEIFKTIRFPEGKLHEDEFTALDIINMSKNICFDRTPLYNYLIRSNSIMSSKYGERNLVVLDAVKSRIEFFKYQYPSLYINSIKDYINSIINSYFKLEDKELKKNIISRFQNELKTYKQEIKKLTFKFKIKIFLFKNFRFFLQYRNKKH